MGFFLVESALCIVLLKSLFALNDLNDDDIGELRSLYDDLSDGKLNLEGADAPECLRKLEKLFLDYKISLSEKCRTAKLWLQFIDYVQILKDFIRAERTGNWALHLVSVHKMLNLFAATGQNNYAKCGRLYLHTMYDLPETHPWLHDQFMTHGHHSVRRSDRYWAALSTDLIIKQVMMKAIKGRGGLTHGRGMTESVRLLWIRSMHKCASVRNALSFLTDPELTTTDNLHADLGKSRMDRDCKDLSLMLDWLQAHNPFNITDGRLRGVASGLVASDHDKVDCDNIEEIGHSIMIKMDDVAFADVVLRKADQIRPISTLDKTASISTKSVTADNQVLFNRLLVTMTRLKPENLQEYFKYELTTVPTALFTDHGLRKTNKATLTTELRKTLGKGPTDVVLPGRYIIDGGCLLHRVVWNQTGTYSDVAKQYLNFVIKHYGQTCTVVFDGYASGPSIKDHEHVRRAKDCDPDVEVIESNPAFRSQSAFLKNAKNKQAFVLLLSNILKRV